MRLAVCVQVYLCKGASIYDVRELEEERGTKVLISCRSGTVTRGRGKQIRKFCGRYKWKLPKSQRESYVVTLDGWKSRCAHNSMFARLFLARSTLFTEVPEVII